MHALHACTVARTQGSIFLACLLTGTCKQPTRGKSEAPSASWTCWSTCQLRPPCSTATRC